MADEKDFSHYEEEYAYKQWERENDYDDDCDIDDEEMKELMEKLEKRYAKKPKDGKPRVRL